MGSTNGTVHLYERDDGRELFRRVRTLHIAKHPTARVLDITVPENEESLVCSLDNSQIVTFSLTGLSDSVKVYHRVALSFLLLILGCSVVM